MGGGEGHEQALDLLCFFFTSSGFRACPTFIFTLTFFSLFFPLHSYPWSHCLCFLPSLLAPLLLLSSAERNLDWALHSVHSVQCSSQCAACSLTCTDVQSEAVSKLCSVQPTVSNFDCLLSEALCSQHCQCLMVHCAVNTLCAIVLV